jgi:penicillin-binding protein 1C
MGGNWARTASIVCAMVSLALTGSAPAAQPDFTQVKAAWQPSEAWLLDRHGEVIQERRVDALTRRTDWTPLAEVSPALIGAVLHAEDKRFFEHGGVDWLAAGHAALTNLFTARPRGASTLTMQLAALLDAQLRARKGRRGIGEKWDQMQAARDLDAAWSKTQILEAYFNLLPMRGDLVGIDATSRALFDKRPAGLSPAEAILLAALIRSPNAKPAEVAKRACALAAGLDNAPRLQATDATQSEQPDRPPPHRRCHRPGAAPGRATPETPRRTARHDARCPPATARPASPR